MANYTQEKSYLERIADALENGGGGITPSGNIEITENGENINVAQYATATVNVSGGGGLAGPFCILEIENTSTVTVTYGISTTEIEDSDFMSYHQDIGYFDYGLEYLDFAAQETKTLYTIPLPKMTDPEDPTSIIPAIAISIEDSNITITDLVNCTVVAGTNGRYLQITDPSEYAHAKISYEMSPK